MIIAGEGSKTMSESEEQICLFRWAQWACGKYPELKLLFHVPNEGRKKRLYGSTYAFGRTKSRCPGHLLTRGKKKISRFVCRNESRKKQADRKSN